MNIWCFGDSYIDFRHEGEGYVYHQNQWMQRVATVIGGNLHNFGRGGTSLEWVYKNFFDNLNEIQEGDIVLVALTGLNRRWLLSDHPENAYWRTSPTDDPDENKAFKYYTLYLDHAILHEYYLRSFLYALDSISERLGLHTVVLPCFQDVDDFLKDKRDLFQFLNIAIGNLVTISFNEYTMEVNYDRDNIWDIKTIESESFVNHMLCSNHINLADKVIDNIRNRNPIDLTEGFRERFITRESFTDYDFCAYENFGFPLNLRLPNPFGRDYSFLGRHRKRQ